MYKQIKINYQIEDYKGTEILTVPRTIAKESLEKLVGKVVLEKIKWDLEDVTPVKYYKVKENVLLKLIEDSLRFNSLDEGGVDNWSYYAEAYTNFLHRYDAESYEELAEEALDEYGSELEEE